MNRYIKAEFSDGSSAVLKVAWISIAGEMLKRIRQAAKDQGIKRKVVNWDIVRA